MASIKEKIQKLFLNNRWKNNLSISNKEKIIFLEQLSNLLNSWIPIINSLKILILQSKNKNKKKLIELFINNINKWRSIKEIWEKLPKIFNKFDTSIIEMWEVSWRLWESIEMIKIKEEKTRELKWKILWALIYPMLIMTLASAMIVLFMIYIIPKINEMYKDANVNLPDFTKRVIYISDFLQANIWILIIWLLIFIVLINFFRKYKKTKIYFDFIIIKIPIFGPLIKKKILALFSYSLWVLLSRWVIINKSIEISAWAINNDYYEKEIRNIIDGISKWQELSSLMWINSIQNWKESKFFPIELSSIVKIWEQTWKLSTLLINISEKFNKEIDNIVKNISTAIEPIIIIFVWIVVWTLIMAVLLPFFNMVNVIWK